MKKFFKHPRGTRSAFLLLALAGTTACGAADDDALDQEDSAGAEPELRLEDLDPDSFPTNEPYEVNLPDLKNFEAKAPAYREDPAADEDVAKGFLRKSTQSNAETFYWSKVGSIDGYYGDWDVTMKPVNSHVCFMTRVAGNLGGWSNVTVHRSSVDMASIVNQGPLGQGTILNESGTSWKLAGFQAQANSLIAEATCVPMSDFKTEAGGTRQVSTMGWKRLKPAAPGCNMSGSVRMWDRAMTFLSEVQGNFEGGGEYGLTEYDSTNHQTRLRAGTQDCGDTLEIGARSFFAAKIGAVGQPAFSVYNYAVSASSGATKTVTLTRTRDSACYINRVSGDFEGSAEGIRIYPQVDASGVEWWKAEAKAGGGSVFSSVSCIRYDQTPLIFQ